MYLVGRLRFRTKWRYRRYSAKTQNDVHGKKRAQKKGSYTRRKKAYGVWDSSGSNKKDSAGNPKGKGRALRSTIKTNSQGRDMVKEGTPRYCCVNDYLTQFQNVASEVNRALMGTITRELIF